MPFELNEEEGKFLVKLARRAVKEYLETKKVTETTRVVPEKLLQPCGVFVTINSIENEEKELRGCIGYPYPTDPLVEAVIQSAISAATQDPRFDSLTKNELGKVVFEVSVLTPPQVLEVKRPQDYPSKIKIGEDGLIIEKGMFKGLLLPQVPVEWNWDQEEFLCQCCIKAGLTPDNWLLPSTRIQKFQAIIFEEETPNGKVKRKALGGT
ncbi:AMMECR1 domain-containing protein [Candidatus Bathyarchaeota archaeon RBG_13_46_16b]|nr:MAG: AMMECR1 domain-containing protein [Candidatus Bathyarchaeota archaeon RBG_13_46_16b]